MCIWVLQRNEFRYGRTSFYPTSSSDFINSLPQRIITCCLGICHLNQLSIINCFKDTLTTFLTTAADIILQVSVRRRDSYQCALCLITRCPWHEWFKTGKGSTFEPHRLFICSELQMVCQQFLSCHNKAVPVRHLDFCCDEAGLLCCKLCPIKAVSYLTIHTVLDFM